MSDDGFPMRLYEYDANGRYSSPVYIAGAPGLELVMATIVRACIAERREVRITDSGDFLVFHAENGIIVFPTEDDMVAEAL